MALRKTNLYILDQDADICAKYLSDIHVSRGVIHVAQILSNVVRRLIPVPGHPILDTNIGNDLSTTRFHATPYCQDVYLSNNFRSSVTDWVCRSYREFVWVLGYYRGLIEEYKYRFGKDHKTGVKIPPRVFNTYAERLGFFGEGHARFRFPERPPLNVPYHIQKDPSRYIPEIPNRHPTEPGLIIDLYEGYSRFEGHETSTWEDRIFLYRKYYCIEKFQHGFWTGRDTPEWYYQYHLDNGAKHGIRSSKNSLVNSTTSFMYYPSGENPSETYRNSFKFPDSQTDPFR